MNKQQLNARWGASWSTNQIVDDMQTMLKNAKHPNSVHGVCTLLNESFTNKASLLAVMMGSAHYVGDGRIVIPAEFARTIDGNEVYSFFSDMDEKFNLDHLLAFQDAQGKTILDHLITGKKVVNLAELVSKGAENNGKSLSDTFDIITGATKETAAKYYEVKQWFNKFRNQASVNLRSNISIDRSDLTFREGTKTSRAFNEMCCLYGVDKLNPQEVTREVNGQMVTRTVYPYNQVFAKYSDLVSNLARKMYFVISINPLDYLAMSNGINWHSCYRITDGCYKGGTISYMLDQTSIVTYVVSDLDKPLHEAPRYYRQMIHYDGDMFMQNRLYPQGNDGATDLYTKFRDLVIAEFSDLLETNGEWTVEVGTAACRSHIRSEGVHYADYTGNRSCNIFYPASKRAAIVGHIMRIGHAGICTKCGRAHTVTNRLAHNRGDLECVMEGNE